MWCHVGVERLSPTEQAYAGSDCYKMWLVMGGGESQTRAVWSTFVNALWVAADQGCSYLGSTRVNSWWDLEENVVVV